MQKQTNISSKADASVRKKNYERDRENEKVKGIFKCYEVPGGQVSFFFRGNTHGKRGDKIERYDMIDGHVYEVPLAVAKHLNNNCYYPVHSYQKDESGKPVTRIGQKVHRVGFQSLDFVDVNENQPDIVTVENV